ncbi:RNA-binding protein [Sphingobacteriales bacterium UPWRP_1]|nr:RNA-binding protein [Sphingobacteriales bacterium UPWRP_1]
MPELLKMRVDKWLWAVRIFKTRSLATDACHAGKIKINGNSIKASYLLKTGETLSIQKDGEKKILKVLALIEKRVGAPVAATCYEDLSPPPENSSQQQDALFYYPAPIQRKRGTGRPTKKERREIDKLHHNLPDEEEDG